MKIRRVDFYPDDLLAGIAGQQLSLVEFGTYWAVITLIYSRGDGVPDDPAWLSRMFRDTDPRTVRAAVKYLVSIGKVARDGANLVVMRCLKELERAENRTRKAAENGTNGGRPSNKNNDIPKPGGFSDEKLTTNNQQSATNTHQSESQTDDELEFEAWWLAYPRHVAKGKARVAYRKARKGIAAAVLQSAVERYAAERASEPVEYTKHPTTWLNGECWNDEPQPKSTANRPHGPGTIKPTADIRAAAGKIAARIALAGGVGEAVGGAPTRAAGERGREAIAIADLRRGTGAPVAPSDSNQSPSRGPAGVEVLPVDRGDRGPVPALRAEIIAGGLRPVSEIRSVESPASAEGRAAPGGLPIAAGGAGNRLREAVGVQPFQAIDLTDLPDFLRRA